MEAIKRGEDIIIPIISLDRPLIVFYEIVTRLFESGVVDPKEVDLLHFGNLIDKLLGLVPRNNPMWLKIKKYIKPISKDHLKNFQKK